MLSRLLMIVPAVLFAGAVLADQATTQADQAALSEMEKLDTDQDQRISQEEAVANPVLVERWITVDVNKDGTLDTAEFVMFTELENVKAQNQSGQ